MQTLQEGQRIRVVGFIGVERFLVFRRQGAPQPVFEVKERNVDGAGDRPLSSISKG